MIHTWLPTWSPECCRELAVMPASENEAEIRQLLTATQLGKGARL